MRHLDFIHYERLSQSFLVVNEINIVHCLKLLRCLNLCILNGWIKFTIGWSI